MPFTSTQLKRLLAPDLIPAARVKHLATRACETYLKRRTYALEDATVRRLYALYEAFYRDLRAVANDEAERRGITKLAGDPAGTAWRDAVVRVTEQTLVALIDAVSVEALRTALVAYQGNYYGRLWLLDMATNADVRIPKTPPPMDVLYRQVTQPLLREDVYDDLIRSLMGKEWRAQFADQMDGITLDVRRAIAQGLMEGESVADVMRRVRDALGVQTDRRKGYRANFNRVQAITRTVINKVSNEGGVSAYRANADVLGGYEWLTAKDEAVCDQCRGLNGTTYKLDDSYRPPAHPNCILPGNVVSLPGKLVGAVKSRYVGVAVEIVCRSGSRITVTQNHPILTPDGWVAAKDMRVGGYVFRTSNVEGVAASVNPDNEYGPAAVEDVFDAFMMSRGMSTASVKTAAEDFHGDARFFDGDVDIVRANSLLLSDIQPAQAQPVGQSGFNDGGMGKASLLTYRPPLEIGDRALRTFNCLVCGENHVFPLFGIGSFPAEKHGIGHRSWFDAAFEQSPPEGGTPDPSLARKFLFRFSGDIASDEIVEVRDFDFSGHVYDLQVEPYQLYICNTVIVKNCRCTVIPVIRADYLTAVDEPPRQTFGEWGSGYGMDRTIADFLGKSLAR